MAASETSANGTMICADDTHVARKTPIAAHLVSRELRCVGCCQPPAWYVRIFHSPTSSAVERCGQCSRSREASPCSVCAHDGHSECTRACKANCDGCNDDVYCDDVGVVLRMCAGCVDTIAATPEPVAAWARRASAVQTGTKEAAAHPVFRGIAGTGKGILIRLF